MRPTPIQRWLPPFALAGFVLGVIVIIAVAGATLGYDYHAYVNAAHRLLDGQRLYDPAVSVAGGFAIYLYPPPFAVAMVPFALLPETAGLWLWLVGLIVAFLAGVALLPVRREVRWAVVLLAGVSWPFLYSIKLGQVGPLLFLAFAAGWRGIDRPKALGLSMAMGVLVKLQPAILVGWALVTRRWAAAAVAIGACLVAAALVTPFIGLSAWTDYVDLLRRVSTPVTTPHNFTPGAIAFQAGASQGLADAIQSVTLVATVLVAVAAWLRADATSSFVTTVVASQLLSPLLWDHYAMVLLIPTALLLERRHWWAVVIPLAGWLPAFAVPFTFAVALVAPVFTGSRRTRAGPGPAGATPA